MTILESLLRLIVFSTIWEITFGNSSEVAIIKGRYVGSGNDGVLLQDVEVIDTFTI